MGHTMAVKEFSGPKWVIRLPDRKTLSDEAKEYLDEQFTFFPFRTDGELWVTPGDGSAELQELQQLGFNGEDHTDPDMYFYVPYETPDLEIPWALRTPVRYLDGKEPRMQLLWVMKGSSNMAYIGRPFELATMEQFSADLDIPRTTLGAYLHEDGVKMRVVLGDITEIKTDIIVNSADTSLYEGGGVSGAIHRAAGPELQKACLPFSPIKTGQAITTPAFELEKSIGAKYVIHAVGPRYPVKDYDNGNPSDPEAAAILFWTYNAVCIHAKHLLGKGAKSITIPSISTGNFRFPLKAAASIAFSSLRELLPESLWCTIVCFDQATFDAYSYVLEHSIAKGKQKKRIEWID